MSDEKPSFEEWRAHQQKGRKRDSLAKRMKNSRFMVVRGFYQIGHITSVIFMAIGAFIAWLIGFLFI